MSVRKHLERNRKDKDSKFRLILIESRIHRLTRYYKTKGAGEFLKLLLGASNRLQGMSLTLLLFYATVPPSFKYESATASTLVA